jgi:integrase
MALIKRNNIWHAYYRGIGGKLTFRSTGCTDKLEAKALEPDIMAANREAKRKHRIEVLLGRAPVEEKPLTHQPAKPKNRVKLSELLDTVQKYREISQDHIKTFSRFIKYLPPEVKYCDQVTPEIAFKYLQDKYKSKTGKSWNNNKTYLNSLFRVILIDAGLSESPFARVPQMRDFPKHQRPFTDEECVKIINACKEPWKSASMIAYHTGMRQKDCFGLKWSDIKGGIITITPAKTSRFGKSVQIPIHPQLSKWLDKLPRRDELVLGFGHIKYHKCGSFNMYFGSVLDTLKIINNESGIVGFGSFRNSFNTRCDKAQIPEHATMGITGHADKKLKRLYSHDLTAAMAIKQLPSLQLDNAKKCNKNTATSKKV